MSNTAPHNMDPRFAWSELPRLGAQKRSASARVADFLEIHGPFDEATAREQASRCIQCPEPACVEGCPLSNRIPEWLALTAEGHFLEAAALLHSTSSLPEICARVCPADRLCEGRCILNGKTEPVSIGAIEQFLNEYAFAHGGSGAVPPPPNGLRVAVVGAGPGGLTCADTLCRRGYSVTVFDWRLVPGGLLVSGTPGFRLERSVVQRRVEMLERMGVVFHLGVNLEEELRQQPLRERFDAVFLGFGARRAREMQVPGRELKGVVPAVLFLVQGETNLTPSQLSGEVTGRRVVVLGGGDMAVDCVRTALRAGAREVVCAYRRDEASLPCIRSEYESAVEEGARFLFQAVPAAVLGNERGEVAAVRLTRTELGAADETGRRSFRVVPGEEFEIPADCVLPALGFEPLPLPEDNPFGPLARNETGGLQVDERQMTSLPGVFAGGDLVRGPSRILDVVRDARRAAEGIHSFLLPKLSGTTAPVGHSR